MYAIFVKRIYRFFFFSVKRIYLYVSKKVLFDVGAYADRQTIFAGNNFLGERCFLSCTSLGFASYVADFSKIFFAKIGKFTSIGQNVCTAIGKHPISENISTSPSFCSLHPSNQLKLIGKKKYEELELKVEGKYSVEIGNDVWIGNNVVILQGVRIADGAIVGAGAVVIKDVEPYAIYVGNPARCIGYRFEKETIDKLLKLQWWNKDVNWLKEHAEEFANVGEFVEKWGTEDEST